MKRTLFLLLALPLFSYSQKDSIVTYTDVVKVDNVSKDELYMRARAWLADAFNSSKEVLQVQDKETGELIGKGTMETSIPWKNFLYKGNFPVISRFKFSIWVKENKYKYEITDIDNEEIKTPSPTYHYEAFGLLYNIAETKVKWSMVSRSKMNEYFNNYKEGVNNNVKGLIMSLNNAMLVKPKSNF
jgi:hypothetical protein